MLTTMEQVTKAAEREIATLDAQKRAIEDKMTEILLAMSVGDMETLMRYVGPIELRDRPMPLTEDQKLKIDEALKTTPGPVV